MSAHTPGPWVLEASERYHEPFRIYEPLTRELVAIVTRDVHMEGDADSNARILAAGPEMLETLKLLWLDAKECADWTDEYRNKVDAVIAKAEGRAGSF